MRVLITRYPASEDRLIVRPLLCRRCALRLQPAEPQPYRLSLVRLVESSTAVSKERPLVVVVVQLCRWPGGWMAGQR